MSGDLTKEQFCERFVSEMMTAAPIYDGSKSDLQEYAEEIAPTYWEEIWQREDGPEICAQNDISYWEQDQ